MFKLNARFQEEADGGEGDGGAGGAAGGAAPTWLDGLPDEDKAFIANKGWKEPSNMVRGYRNLEKMHGVPAEKLLRIPDANASDDERNQYFSKLGRPDTPEGYAFPENGDKDFQNWARNTFHKEGLSADAAKGIIEGFDAHMAERQAARVEQVQMKRQEEARNLRKEWGARYDVNEKLAARAAQAMGVTDEQIDALENALGYNGVLKLFHGMASKISEDTFAGAADSGSNLMTPAQANQKIAELKSDRSFRQKLVSGDISAKRQMDELHRMAFGKVG